MAASFVSRISFAVFVISAFASSGQYRTGTVYFQTLQNKWPISCSQQTVYDPEIYVLPGGDLRALVQGNNQSLVDSFYAFRRASSTGAWDGPTESDPFTLQPSVRGRYTRCGYSSTNPGPVASPGVVVVDGRYYMAYVGGNADYIAGYVYWATSADGVNWTHTSSPIVYPYYHNECSDVGSGAGQLELAFENGYFYLFIRYGHYYNGSFQDPERIGYRIKYESAASNGLGNVRQIYYEGTWRTHSGRLIWSYDNQPALAGDFVLSTRRSVTAMRFGAGDVKFDPNLYFYGYWVHFSQDPAAVDKRLHWEYTFALNNPVWTYGGVVDLSSVSAAYPGAQIYYPGAYFDPHLIAVSLGTTSSYPST